MESVLNSAVMLLPLVDDLVAQINASQYATLQEALDAVQPGETITLLKSIKITSAGPITLNLNGSTIDGGDYQLVINGTGPVTITGDGTIKNSIVSSTADEAPLKIYAGSDVVLDGVTVQGKCCAVKTSGNLTVKKADIKADTYGIGCFGNATVNIGTENGPDSAVTVATGGQAIATAAATGLAGMTVNVYSGTFITTGTVWDECPIYWAGHGTLNVYSGHFKNEAAGTGAAALL